ncbi:hypothetical protein [Rubrimonas cliftonensis]|uniref:Uncharacterized protein n=1 Tax=Rubrimonas cliftonensis TaxID=89524 RepID=A0A1H4ERE5_9RHOB|nr:hypothetical protein [Rubrimonas cliftonensis]SEA87439.1 hypothetical protein SAMN05444370_11550 [Rubrimonas cliftonensis]
MRERNHIDPHGVTVIAAPLASLPERAGDAERLAVWADYEARLLSALGHEWTPTRRAKGPATVLAVHRLFELTSFEDGYGRAHVTVAARQDLRSVEAKLAAASLTASAELIFERLALRLSLRIPKGPFETAPWRREPQRRAG